MDRIAKALKRLTNHERDTVEKVLTQLKRGSFASLDVQKLKGHDEIFRIRKGDIRVIIRRADTGALFLLAVERRSEKTYRDF